MVGLRLSLVLALFACTAYALDQPKEKPVKDEPKETIAAVAGNYYRGDGLGMNCRLVVTPEGRFSYTWRGCLGLYDENKGTVTLTDGHLILKPEQPTNKREFRTTTDFIPVQWGKRRYLISQEEMKAFCNDVNQGFEPRDNIHGLFYIRSGDEKNEVTGRPSVPKDWEAFLLKAPIHAKVIKVLPDSRAQIDCGAESGVCKGMELYGENLTRVEVIEVEPKSCLVKVSADRGSIQNGEQVHSRIVHHDSPRESPVAPDLAK